VETIAKTLFNFVGQYYWPFSIILITPVFRLLITGHWAQIIQESVGFKYI
jgi:hypothetical protein